MQIQNGIAQEDQTFDVEIAALQKAVKNLIDHVSTDAKHEHSRLKVFTDTTKRMIKAHPIVFAAVGLGLGYLVGRIVSQSTRS